MRLPSSKEFDNYCNLFFQVAVVLCAFCFAALICSFLFLGTLSLWRDFLNGGGFFS